jgi:hypothetical protein
MLGTNIRWSGVIRLTEGDGARTQHSGLKKEKIKRTDPRT